MEKTIKLNEKSLTLSNDTVWLLEYRDQFGQDIVPTLMPALAAGIDIASGLLNAGTQTDEITVTDVLRKIDGEYLIDAVAHIGGLELTDIIHIAWAMAKAADEDIPEPKAWTRSLGDDFPLDIIVPELIDMILSGMTSRKNLKKLEELKKSVEGLRLKTSTSTTSSSAPQSEA